MDWKTTLEEILAERRKQFPEPPSLDTLIALHAGQLSEAEREQLLEQASVDPTVARELFDTLLFPDTVDDALVTDDLLKDDLVAGNAGSDVASDPDRDFDGQAIDARWQRFRQQLGSEPAVPSPTRRWLPLAAMFVIGVLGTLLLMTWLDRGPGAAEDIVRPRINLSLVELLPLSTDHPGSRGSVETAVLAANADGLVVTLAVPDLPVDPGRSDGSSYQLILDGPRGLQPPIDGLQPSLGGVFIVELPRETLTSGPHRLTLLDADSSVVATFALTVEVQ